MRLGHGKRSSEGLCSLHRPSDVSSGPGGSNRKRLKATHPDAGTRRGRTPEGVGSGVSNQSARFSGTCRAGFPGSRLGRKKLFFFQESQDGVPIVVEKVGVVPLSHPLGWEPTEAPPIHFVTHGVRWPRKDRGPPRNGTRFPNRSGRTDKY